MTGMGLFLKARANGVDARGQPLPNRRRALAKAKAKTMTTAHGPTALELAATARALSKLGATTRKQRDAVSAEQARVAGLLDVWTRALQRPPVAQAPEAAQGRKVMRFV